MQLRRNLLFVIAALVALNLLLAFGAIGLFGRMGPAIALSANMNETLTP
jgi:hypothetical protein